MYSAFSQVVVVLTLLWLSHGLTYAFENSPQNTKLENYVHQQWAQLSDQPFPGVFGLVQDSQGAIWLATFRGVYKFDGVDFLPVFDQQFDDNLRGHISNIAITPDDVIYFVPVNKGLARIKDGKLEHYNEKNGLLCDRVDKITIDTQGQLWYACAKGIVRFGDDPKVWHFEHNNVHISALAIISDEEYLYGTNLGQLYHVTTDQQTLYDKLPQANVLTLFKLAENKWLFSIREHGLFILNNGIIERPELYLPLATANVEKIIADRFSTLWMATTLGVVRVFEDQLEVLDINQQSNVQSRIFSLLIDDQDTLWAGFYAKGLHQFMLPKVNIVPNKSVRTVIEYDNAYWMGTDQEGVFIQYHDGRTRHLSTKDGLPSNTVHAFYADTKGNLWLGTTNGLAKYTAGKITSYDLAPYSLSNWVTTLTADKFGKIWIGTDTGVATIDDGVITKIGDLAQLGKRRVRWIKSTQNNVIWVGTYDGVIFYASGRWQNPSHPQLSQHAQVSFFEDSDGGLWFGSQQGDGLSWLKAGKLSTFTTHDGLFDNFIWTITEDNKGYLWFSSDKGINRINRASLEQLPTTRHEAIRSTTFGRYEGLSPSECNSAAPAPWHTQAGKLIYPCMAGLVEIDPNTLAFTQGVPTNTIDFIVFDDNKRWFPDNLELTAHQRDIRIKYSAIGFDNPKKIQFRYRLQGYQQKWQQAQDRRSVAFTNLSSGDYIFEVSARFYDGDWATDSAKLKLSVAPLFYENLWFAVLVLLVLGYVTHYLYQLRLERILRRRTEIEAAKIDHLSSLIHNVAHNLNTPVGIAITGSSLLPDYHAKLKKMIDSGKVSKKILIELVDGLDQSGAILSKSLTTVSSLIERFKQLNIENYSEQPRPVEVSSLLKGVITEVNYKHPNQNIDWQIDNSPNLTFTSYPQVLSQILQLLVDNTLKHGYPDKADATINIHFKLDKKTLSIVYQDFGTGMTEQELESLFIPFGNRIGDQKGLGLGMNIAYNLITQKLAGRIVSSSSEQSGALFEITFNVE